MKVGMTSHGFAGERDDPPFLSKRDELILASLTEREKIVRICDSLKGIGLLLSERSFFFE